MSGTPAESRFGDPVEIAWWVLPASVLPAIGILLAVIVSTHVGWVRPLLGAGSAAMIAVNFWTSLCVASRNIQMVCLSAAFAAWVFIAVAWFVGAVAPAG